MERWQDHAACDGKDTSIFFKDESDRGRAGYKEAHEICVTCPVVRECLEHALTAPEIEGFWGDKTPRERAQMRGKTITSRTQPIRF